MSKVETEQIFTLSEKVECKLLNIALENYEE